LAFEVRGIWYGYTAQRPVLRDLSLSVQPGEMAMIMGASGSGKTTLLKLIKGLLAPQRGSIEVFAQPVVAASRGQRLDSRVAYIPQQLGLVRTLSALDNCLMGALAHVGTVASLVHAFPRETVDQAHEVLSQLGIGHKAQDKVYALSGGERQRVAIARALMQRPAVILADEFVSQLDPVTSGEIMETVGAIAEDGVAVVVTTHELDLVARYARRVVVLRDGEKVLDAPRGETRVEELAAALKR
jgi:phosphonate transport system ATP-binding protein